VCRAALVQMTASDAPEENLAAVRALVAESAAAGAQLVLTPEVTNCVSASRRRQQEVLRTEAEDRVLAGLQEEASRHGLWLLVGSLALRGQEPGARFVNRSFLLGPDGAIRARYDKIHMFDVDLTQEESFRESAAFAPGGAAVLAETPWGPLGMTVCYDLRFPALYRALAQAGARILAVPSAFSPVTGAAHWEVLLRARAIECGAFVLAPAQTGLHPARGAEPRRERRTHGHSLAVGPWGEVLADGGTAPGVSLVDLRLSDVDDVRARLPSLAHDRAFRAPDPTGLR
jgi:predicted amidohydrolase